MVRRAYGCFGLLIAWRILIILRQIDGQIRARNLFNAYDGRESSMGSVIRKDLSRRLLKITPKIDEVFA